MLFKPILAEFKCGREGFTQKRFHAEGAELRRKVRRVFLEVHSTFDALVCVLTNESDLFANDVYEDINTGVREQLTINY